MSNALRLSNFLDLTAGLAHQLNNDLAAVVGYAEIIADETAADDPISGYATEILVAGRSVRATVERFHTLHRIARADVGSFDIRPALERTCNAIIARSDEAIAVSLNLPTTSLMVEGHSQEILPILRELADVAANAIGGAGTIAMTVHPEKILASKQLSHGTVSHGEYARITLHANANGSDAPEDLNTGIVTNAMPNGSINGELAAARSAIFLLGGAIHIQGLQNTRCGIDIYLPINGQVRSNQEDADR